MIREAERRGAAWGYNAQIDVEKRGCFEEIIDWHAENAGAPIRLVRGVQSWGTRSARKHAFQYSRVVRMPGCGTGYLPLTS